MRRRHPERGPVLAVSSPGGHWQQLLQLSGSWEGRRAIYATADESSLRAANVPGYVIPDGSRSRLWALVSITAKLLQIVIRERPSVVISTGAAPGLIALACGRLLGARTVWVDSIANANRLSLSGRLARRIATLWLTQWPQLARPNGPHYVGALL